MANLKQRQGIIKLIVLIVIAVLILSYFRINLRQLAGSDVTQSNFQYLWSLVLQGWDKVATLWQEFVSGPFYQALDRYR